MSNDELARREERAQHGIIEFAEEMQYIREHNLYPNAGETNSGKLEPWATYCKERWGMGKAMVDKIILARPVMERRSHSGATRTTVEAAATVATLPVPVQDAILDSAESRDDARAKAKAVRQVQRKAENEGREAGVDEQLDAVENFKAKPKVKTRRKFSKFTRHLEAAYHEAQQAADYAQGDVLSDTENDFAWNRVAKVRYELERIEDKLYQPETVKNIDAEFAELLGGETR